MRRKLAITTLCAATVLFLAAVCYFGSPRPVPPHLQATFRLAMSEAITIPDWTRDFALVDIAKAQARAGDIAGADGTAQKISDPAWAKFAIDEIAIREGLSGSSALWTRVRNWFGRKNRVAPRDRLSIALSASGRWEDAIRMAETVSDPDRQAAALRDAAVARAKAGDFTGALAMADSNRLGSYRAFALLGIATAMRERRSPAAAAAAISRALAVPEVYQYQRFLVTTWAARERNELGQGPAGRALLEASLKDAQSITDKRWRAFYTTEVLASMAGLGQSGRALRLAESLTSGSDRDFACRQISSFSAASGDRIAIDIALRIRDPMRRDQALRAVACAYARRRNFSGATRAESLILDPDKRELSGRYLATQCFRAGLLQEGRKRMSRMQAGAERAQALQAICRHLGAGRSMDEALREARSGATELDRAMGYIGAAEGWMDRDNLAYPVITRDDI